VTTLPVTVRSAAATSTARAAEMLHDLEVDIVVSQPQSLTSLEVQFQADLENSRRVTLEDWKRRPRVYLLIERFFLMFKRWL
jgi:hypothetical protein